VLRDGSPDRRASAASGESARPDTSARLLPGIATLTGLRTHSVLRDGSPDRRASAASGESARPDTSARFLPGGAAPPPGNAPGLVPRRGFFPVALR
ncbi:hypothetical protein, partial [Klebsiella grimontii]